MSDYVPLHSPTIGDKEKEAVLSTLDSKNLKGGGKFDEKCSSFIESNFNVDNTLMTTSCTHALEMAAQLVGIDDSDEVIIPSYTFASTATAFVMCGAEITFCEIEKRTLTMDPDYLEKIISKETAAVVPVHYAGSACRMDEILSITDQYNVPVIEDAAQGVNASYKGDYLGTMGDIGCYSFQGTKNYVGGEGGALLLNDNQYLERAEYLRQKGTNYEKFRRGEVDKYTWVDTGSSYVPSELQTALIHAQLKRRDEIQSERASIYKYYQQEMASLESEGLVQLPDTVDGSSPNYHIFYLILDSVAERDALAEHLDNYNIDAAPHYQPLHQSKMGRSFESTNTELPITEYISEGLLRLPIHANISKVERKRITNKVTEFFE